MTDTAPAPRLAWLQVHGVIGQPVRLVEVAVRATEATPHGTFRMQVMEGRKWRDTELFKTRIGPASVGISQGRISGGVWFFEEDRLVATRDLIEAAREALVTQIGILQVTLDSLPDADPRPEVRPPGP